MRDLLILLLLMSLAPVVLVGPQAAVLLWAWASLLSPSTYLYGFTAQIRYTEIFAIAAIVLVVIAEGRKLPRSNLTTWLLAIFVIHASLSTFLSEADPEITREIWENLLKVLALSAVVLITIDSKIRLHTLLIVISLALGFHATTEGLKFILSGGSHHIFGPQRSSFVDNNHYAAVLLMVIPITGFLAKWTDNKFSKLAFQFVFVLMIVTVIGTFSRGGFLGLLAIGSIVAWRSRGRLRAWAVLVPALLLVSLVIPDDWFTRIDTIRTADQDNSFMGRVIAWKISILIALDNPVFGGGFRAVQDLAIWQQQSINFDRLRFIPTAPVFEDSRAAHSIYFEVLGDLGFVGLALFLGIFATAWRNATKLRRQLSESIGGRESWAYDLAGTIQLSLAAFLVSGAALSFAYFDLAYLLVAMSSILAGLYLRSERARPPRFPDLGGSAK